MAIISIKNLKKSYNGEVVLDIPSLEIEAGKSFGLVGNNGAGKTTLYRCLLDLIEPDSGEVLINNIPVAKDEEWKNFTGSFIDEGFLIDYLTPDEYFGFIAKLHDIPEEELSRVLDRPAERGTAGSSRLCFSPLQKEQACLQWNPINDNDSKHRVETRS